MGAPLTYNMILRKNLKYFISVFNKTDDNFVADMDLLIPITLVQLQGIFHFDKSDPMIGEIPINKEIADKLTGLGVITKIDLDSYDYFLGCCES